MANLYPQNFKEAIISALPNCAVMVVGMVFMNLWLYRNLTIEHFFHTIILMYITAFILDFFIIGKITSWFVNKHNIQKYTPFIRVGLMAGILTFFAPMLESGFVPHLHNYLMAFPRNYIVALALQIFIAMKLGMFILGKYRLCEAREN